MRRGRIPQGLEFDLVRVTEAAALAASRFVGRDDKKGADQAAVDAMREVLNSLEMKGIVVIGEGEKDEAPMLFNGEKLGTGSGPELDIAVDPIDGTTPCAKGRENSIATVSAAPRGTLYDPGPFVYMDKIAVGPACKGAIDIEKPVAANLKSIAKALQKKPSEITVVVLERTRHEGLIAEIREFGACVRLIFDGDVMGAILAAWPGSGVDALMGIGGSPEGVLAACALRGLGGEIQCKPYPRDENEAKRGREMGFDLHGVLTHDELVGSEEVLFAATGITDGAILSGVSDEQGLILSQSLVINGAVGSVREVWTTHPQPYLAGV